MRARAGLGWQVALALAVAVAVYVLWIAFRIGGDYPTTVVDDAGETAAGFLAAAAAFQCARASDERVAGAGWMLLSVTLLLIAIAYGHNAYLEIVLRTSAAPSTIDLLLYGCSNILEIVAVLLLFGRGIGGLRPRLLLDGGIVAGALALISWLTVLRAVYQPGSSWFDLITVLSAPVSDVIVLVIVVSAVAHSPRLDPARLLVAAAMVAFVCSDTALVYLSASGTSVLIRLADAGWFTGFLVLAAATRVQTPPALADAGGVPAAWQLALPYVPLVGAGGLVLGRLLAHQPIDAFTVVVITAMVVLLLGRQFLAVAETRALAVRLEETVESWKAVSTEREILIESAPVGICRLDADGRLLTTNRTLRSILRLAADPAAGGHLLDLVHPEDRGALTGNGNRGTLAGEARFVRGDGTLAWCAYATVAVPGVAGRPDTGIAIVEDVNELRQDAERAAAVQRQLLPHGTPAMLGYELVGTCMPALNVAGDFYDWVVSDSRVDITLADVMGKGMGAALVTAALRSVLRAASPALGPGRRLTLAAETMALGLEGLFVTVFLARLDLRTGRLRYVDAGHGHCAVRREAGDLVRLETRSMPLGVDPGAEFAEGEIVLEPGDSLLLYSDGLVETETGTSPPEALLPLLAGASGAGDLLHRLVATVPPRPADDVTAVVLRRLPRRTEPAQHAVT